jgi:FkbM family methyltransferase
MSHFVKLLCAEHRVNALIVAHPRVPRWMSCLYGRLRCHGAAALYRSSWLARVTSPSRVIAAYLQSGDVYLDVGCANGEMCCTALGAVGPKGKVYGFDGRAEAVAFVRRMVARFGVADQVRVEHVLVGSQAGVSEFFIDLDHPTSSSRVQTWVRATKHDRRIKKVSMPVVSLDGWSKDSKVDHVDLIKIDVEGAELEVLKGSVELLRRSRPLVLMEVRSQHGWAGEPERAAALSALTEMGYTECLALDGSGLRSRTSLRGLSGSVHDVVAIDNRNERHRALVQHLCVR